MQKRAEYQASIRRQYACYAARLTVQSKTTVLRSCSANIDSQRKMPCRSVHYLHSSVIMNSNSKSGEKCDPLPHRRTSVDGDDKSLNVGDGDLPKRAFRARRLRNCRSSSTHSNRTARVPDVSPSERSADSQSRPLRDRRAMEGRGRPLSRGGVERWHEDPDSRDGTPDRTKRIWGVATLPGGDRRPLPRRDGNAKR